jgi:hypothetical protein
MILKNGKWVAVSKGFAIDDFKGKAISFQMKAKGANNNLEVKLVDEDGSNYGVKRPLLDGIRRLDGRQPVGSGLQLLVGRRSGPGAN